FDIRIKSPEMVTQDLKGHVFYAIFPKEELSGIVFENAVYPSGEATDQYYELIDNRVYKCDPW
ncbi:MAG: hypothetical protein J6Z02_06040, partial [Lachnospiraceae bacterium]|nr:hypothetical protein [Lachnospiraceae bacterium]